MNDVCDGICGDDTADLVSREVAIQVVILGQTR